MLSFSKLIAKIKPQSFLPVSILILTGVVFQNCQKSQVAVSRDGTMMSKVISPLSCVNGKPKVDTGEIFLYPTNCLTKPNLEPDAIGFQLNNGWQIPAGPVGGQIEKMFSLQANDSCTI